MGQALLAGSTALLLTGSMGATALASQPGEDASPNRETSPVTPEAEVSPHVTRIMFEQPQTADELREKLAGSEVLQLRYTGEVSGVSQPGPGVPATQAVDQFERTTTAEYQAAPLVFMAVVDGQRDPASLPGAQVDTFDSQSSAVNQLPQHTLKQASQATRDRRASLTGQGVAVADPQRNAEPVAPGPQAPPKEYRWSPIQGQMQTWDTESGPEPEHPRKFRYNMTWASQADINAFGDDFGLEHGATLYNTEDISDWTRPYCNPFDFNEPYNNFWAAWDSGFKWNAVEWGTNVPGEAAPYWDWDDATDSCQELGFQIGVGYPTNLQPRQGYSMWIHASRGDQSNSEFTLNTQKISNDCNDVGLDPGSSCMGLNYNRPGSGTEDLVTLEDQQGWTVPGCVNWNPTRQPTRLDNGQASCPANG
ncbi:hypothetical protein [Salinifilum aidingensis]